MRLSHNLTTLNIYREHTKVLERQSKSFERISSGNKLNSAKDNAVKIGNSERMRIQIRGLEMAQRNVQDGMSMLQTADGGLEGIGNMLKRIRELTIQSGGNSSDEDKENIQLEINQLVDGINDIAKNTEFNGVKLLNADENKEGKYDNKNPMNKLFAAVGANVGEKVDIPIFDLTADNVGDNENKLKSLSSVLDKNGGLNKIGIDKSIQVIDSCIDSVLNVRSKYGAICNRFESSYNKIGEISNSIQKSESRIRDADIAEEMMNFTRDNVLIESGNAMMVQSNKIPQDVLRILENVKVR